MLIYTQPEGNKESEDKNMGNEIYMKVTITDFGNGNIRCVFSESINDEPIKLNYIDINKARKLMWELVLAGGKRSVSVNAFDRDIVTSGAYIFLPN